MDRMIRVMVAGHYLTKDSNIAGVQYESNARVMRIEFDPGWDGVAKKVTFWDADGKNPVERVLTADLLEDMSTNTRAYLCPIPGEAMTVAGEMTFIIDGYVEGKRQRSMSDTLKVKAAPFIEKAGEPTDPTPTQAEQLQVQIDTLLGDIQAESNRAQNAADEAVARAESAAASEANAAQSEQTAGRYAVTAQKCAEDAEIAEAGAQAAQKAAETARDEARQISGGEFAPLKHTHTAADVGAVSKAGDTMTNDLRIAKVGYPQLSLVEQTSGRRFRVIGGEHGALRNARDDANYRALSISPETSDIKSALRLTQNVDGVWSEYNVLHSGNCSNYAVPVDGSKAMTGHLNVRSGNAPNPIKLYTEENGAGFVGTHEDNGVYKFVRFLPSNVSNVETAHFVSNVSGEYKEYPILHSGNFSSYAVNKSGDVMTGALRVASAGGNVVMDSNANHAYMQTYKDGDWGGRRSLVLRNRADDPDMTNALSLGTLDDGTWKEHSFIHTGNLHLLNSMLGGAKIKTGSYLGNGSYGGTSPNSIQLDFDPDMVLVQDAGMSGANVWGLWMKGCLMFMSPNSTYSSFVQDSSKNFKWASTSSAAGQFNSSGVAYGYMAISFG